MKGADFNAENSVTIRHLRKPCRSGRLTAKGVGSKGAGAIGPESFRGASYRKDGVSGGAQ